jgi:hypothetical protein
MPPDSINDILWPAASIDMLDRPERMNRPWMRVVGSKESADHCLREIFVEVESLPLFFLWVSQTEELLVNRFAQYNIQANLDRPIISVHSVPGWIGTIFRLELNALCLEQTHLIAAALEESHCYLPV